MALARKVTLRLPFLVLYAARIGVRRDDWQLVYAEWKAELWFILRDRDTHWLARFVTGMRFAVPLALGGARQTVTADAEAKPKRRIPMAPIPPLIRRIMVTVSAASGGYLVTNMLPLYGIQSYLAAVGIGAATLGIQWVVGRNESGRDRNGDPDQPR